MARLNAAAREAIVRENLRLAYHLSALDRYRRWGLDREDREQEAVLGLCQAAQAFDPDAHPGVPFSSFARTHVIGCIWRAIIRHLAESNHVSLPCELASADPDRLESEVSDALDELPVEEQQLIAHRFGLDGGEPVGLLGLADLYGCSVRQVTRMLAVAREHLRVELERRGWTEPKARQAAEIGRKLA
jgi:RNA polymerase sigma factor (sigma-70 family)